jgi:pimeloyl-ACP methyl ester carboxylesterase
MRDFETLELQANGLRFSALTQGEGEVVICLHGFPDHARSFRLQLPVLAEAGYRAIAPTMRGYEPSSQPADADYHLVRMAEDVVGWLDHLGVERAHLVGHDWGAAIAYVAGALAPERFGSLTTLAVPYGGRLQDGIRKLPSQILNSWYMIFFQLRGLADFAVETRDWALIDKLWRDWSPGWDPGEDEKRALKRTLAQPGVKAAALGYYRAMFDTRSEAAKQTRELSEAKVSVPTLALTGVLDGCIDTRLYDHTMLAADFPAGLEVYRMEGAGHFLHQEKPQEFNVLLLDWLKRSVESA